MKENKCSKKKKIVWLLAILTFVIAIFATSGIQQKQDSFTETNKTVLNSKSEKKSPESTIHSNGGNPGRSTDNVSYATNSVIFAGILRWILAFLCLIIDFTNESIN